MVTARTFWINAALMMVRPVLDSICKEEFKEVFPALELRNTNDAYSHLEALARSLQGVAPWLELQQDPEAVELAPIARHAISLATDPNSTQYLNFYTDTPPPSSSAAAAKMNAASTASRTGRRPHGQALPMEGRWRQPLVDAAILAHALLRAPTELWGKLEPAARSHVVAALKLSRRIPPFRNNWVLFASMVETALVKLAGEAPDAERLVRGLQLHRTWYLGDGWWGDGPKLALNYYNSFVIQPMLYDILEALCDHQLPSCGSSSSSSSIVPQAAAPPADTKLYHRHHHTHHHRHHHRSRLLLPNSTSTSSSPNFTADLRQLLSESLPRAAFFLESLIHPDGSFPAIGRSLVYRAGAFHLLSLAALKQILPDQVPPAQARAALTRVLNRTLGPGAGAYDNAGWLRVGLAGSQPGLAQHYISQGSLYQAAAVFLPLGLPARDPFWSDPAAPTTWERVWEGRGELPELHPHPAA